MCERTNAVRCGALRLSAAVGAAAVTMLSGSAFGQTLAIFTFDDGTAKDLSGNGETTSLFGSPGPTFSVAGSEGFGIATIGNNGVRVNLNINPSAVPRLTMGAWVKPSVVTTNRHLLSHDNGGYDRDLDIDSRGGGAGWSAFKGNGVLGYVPAIANQWQFVAVVYDDIADTVTLYVDGVVKNGAGSPGTGNMYMYIGASTCCDTGINGVIDGVFVLGEALSTARLDEIRNGGIRKAPTCPIFFEQPEDFVACNRDAAEFHVIAAGAGNLTVQWQFKTDLGTWVDVGDGEFPGVGDLIGTDTPDLSVINLQPGAKVRFRAMATNACAPIPSREALLTVCSSDTNCDGFVNGDDYDSFASAFETADPAADLNKDGFVNGDDYDFFASAFEAGC
ncbi:MAG: LamG-like jellyroll fold domain-containing protein [Phycisphaerales bacterium]